MKMVNKKNGVVIEIQSTDNKTGTVIAQICSGNNSGEIKRYSTGTIKRWYKEFIEETVEEVEQVEEVVEHKLVPMPGIEKLAELAEQTKKKSKQKTSKIDRTNDLSEIDAFIENNYNNKYYESVKCYKIIKDGKTVAEVYPRKKNIEVRVKTVKDDFNSDIFYKDGYKYYLPVHYFIEYSTDYIKLISDLIG